MSNNKKVDQQERKQKLSEKEALEEMLQNSASNLEALTDEAKKLAPKHKPMTFDYQEIMKIAQDESTDIVGANALFYLSEDIIKTEEYIQQKMRSDVATMSDLLRQAKIAEYAIIKMIEQIEEGDMHPRQFEVLAGFQRSKLDLTKSIANYVVVMENNYKAIKEDYKSKRNENTLDISSEVISDVDANGDLTQRGTRGMIQMVRGVLDEDMIQQNKEKMRNAEKNRLGDQYIDESE